MLALDRGYICWASGSMLKPHVLHNLCLQMSRNILKISTSLIHASKTHAFISSPCVTRHGHVFLPLGVILTKYASVSQLNKSICSNICPGPPSVNTKACIFVRRQMSTTWRVSPKLPQIRPILTMISRPRPFWHNPHMAPDSDPARWKIFSDKDFPSFFAAQVWFSEYLQSLNVCPDCHLEK